MALNTDPNAPTTDLSVGKEEEQQQAEQVASQQPDDSTGETPISSQPVKTEEQAPPTDSESTPVPESSVQINGLVKDHLSIIDEQMETSKDYNICMSFFFILTTIVFLRQKE